MHLFVQLYPLGTTTPTRISFKTTSRAMSVRTVTSAVKRVTPGPEIPRTSPPKPVTKKVTKAVTSAKPTTAVQTVATSPKKRLETTTEENGSKGTLKYVFFHDSLGLT